MGYSKNRIEDRNVVRGFWNTLKEEWENLPKGGWVKRRGWVKRSEIFQAYIVQVEPDHYGFELFAAGSEMGVDGSVVVLSKTMLLQQKLSCTEPNQVKREADDLLFEFVATGVEQLGGLTIACDRPPGEIRFVSMSTMPGYVGGLFGGEIPVGLTAEGDVYRFQVADVAENRKQGWVRLDMTRLDK